MGTGEAAKAFQRAERKAKELAFAGGEDKKNQDRMSELASKLQNKIKTYKQQIEEAEEIAALNLAKFRKARQELEETEEGQGLPRPRSVSRSQTSFHCRQLPDHRSCTVSFKKPWPWQAKNKTLFQL